MILFFIIESLFIFQIIYYAGNVDMR